MGKGNKYFTVNMNTQEDNNVSSTSAQNSSNNNNSNTNNTTNLSNTSTMRIKFNEADLQRKNQMTHAVRRIDNPKELFSEDKEQMKPKDIKKVMIPAIALILFCIINEIFIIPLLSKTIVDTVLHGKMDLSISLGNMPTDQMVGLAGVIAIVSYCIFSLGLIGFSIYNLYKRVFSQNDIKEKALKILLYSFLIGFCIVVVDCFININLSELVVKVTTFGIGSITKYLAK